MVLYYFLFKFTGTSPDIQILLSELHDCLVLNSGKILHFLTFREILQNVGNDIVVKAIKTASQELQNKIFGNLSERASEMLREDLEVMGPVKLREVEEAQQQIIRIAKNLEAEGKIVIASKGKEDVYV